MSRDPAGGPRDAKNADPMLARERTDLAWTRSSIAFLALGIAVVKFRPEIGVPLLAFSAFGWLVGRSPPHRDWDGAISRRLRLVAVSVTCLAVIAALLVLIGPVSRGLRP